MAAAAIRRYQAVALCVRGMRSRKGRTADTTSATERYAAVQANVAHELLATGTLRGREILGLLVEEEKLAERLRGLPRGERPELRHRLNHIRTSLHRLDERR